MTRIDFYILSEGPNDAKYLAACKLADKAFRLGNRIYIYTSDATEADRLDRLLWTFSAGSFVPHEIYSESVDRTLPVILGHRPPPETGFRDVLISLAAEAPGFFRQFTRVADLVGGTEEEKRQGRERFRFYRERGEPPNTHHI